jgi:hypothetical protein
MRRGSNFFKIQRLNLETLGTSLKFIPNDRVVHILQERPGNRIMPKINRISVTLRRPIGDDDPGMVAYGTILFATALCI